MINKRILLPAIGLGLIVLVAVAYFLMSGTTTQKTIDASASITLSTNSVVGAAGDTTLTLTIASAMTNTDTIVFTMPDNLDVSGVAFVSETFAGAGTISTCTSAGQVITCTANGAITAGRGNIVMSGIVAKYAATGQTITSLTVNDMDAEETRIP
ncbi:MAG: hypothetical protein WC873_04020 [Candidatus Gracilibacteria bacterium]